jgi:hypothetical protein
VQQEKSKLKTNMIMTVKINENLSFTIGHKTRMGYANGIFDYGNPLREIRGLKPYKSIGNILERPEFWQFVIGINAEDSNKSNPRHVGLGLNSKNVGLNANPCDTGLEIKADYTLLNGYIKDGKVRVGQIIKCFPKYIKSQSGGKVENRGYWMDLRLLLKVATMLDPQLEAQIYDIFINKNILKSRDDGGESFKDINRIISRLPDFNNFHGKHYFSEISRLIRHEVFDLPNYKQYKNIWNDEIATQSKLDKRDNLISKYSMLMNEGYIKSYRDLYDKLGGKDPKVISFIESYDPIKQKDDLNKLLGEL